ncbi:MAG: hypothetical protein WBK88_08315 [Methanothrix sp.]
MGDIVAAADITWEEVLERSKRGRREVEEAGPRHLPLPRLHLLPGDYAIL